MSCKLFYCLLCLKQFFVLILIGFNMHFRLLLEEDIGYIVTFQRRFVVAHEYGLGLLYSFHLSILELNMSSSF